ncbi:MAG: TorF family putative porin [Halioglobus sp.]|nr:TorF family putative porin [Halioglobus sp.]
MMNKKLLTAALAATLMSGAGYSQAEDEFAISGNVALTSDYRFRGISQSDESAAIQGGFDAVFAPGFYIGTWGSSVDFDNNEDYDGSLELDYYGGWRSAIGDTDFGVDVGYIYYDYPGDNGADGDYQEVKVAGSWKTLALSVNYSDDYYAGTDEFWYLAADYSYAFTDSLTLGLHAGYNILEEGEGFLSSDEDNYTDYSVKLTYTVATVGLSVAWVDTTLDEDDVFGTEWGEGAAVFTISKSM